MTTASSNAISSSCSCTTVSARSLASETQDVRSLFVTKTGALSQYTIRLLQSGGLYEERDTLQSAVEKTQKQWLQTLAGKGNRERTDLQDSEQQQKVRSTIETIITEMGVANKRSPSLDRYDYGILLGAFLDGVRNRLAELVSLYKSGVRFDTLVVLTGARALRTGKNEKDSLEDLCNEKLSPLPFKKGWKKAEDMPYTTETDMIRAVLDQVELPEEMAKALHGKIIIVDTPAPEGRQRPSTLDTYKLWIATHKPKEGSSLLAVSYPLLWAYQQLVAENILKGKYTIDTVAQAVPHDENYRTRFVSIVQDTVTKCLYEINS